jgi:hypothetical protein
MDIGRLLMVRTRQLDGSWRITESVLPRSLPKWKSDRSGFEDPLKNFVQLGSSVPPRLPYAALHGEVYHIRSVELMLAADAPWDNNENLKAAMTPRW